jgi:hypothetical protein
MEIENGLLRVVEILPRQKGGTSTTPNKPQGKEGRKGWTYEIN